MADDNEDNMDEINRLDLQDNTEDDIINRLDYFPDNQDDNNVNDQDIETKQKEALQDNSLLIKLIDAEEEEAKSKALIEKMMEEDAKSSTASEAMKKMFGDIKTSLFTMTDEDRRSNAALQNLYGYDASKMQQHDRINELSNEELDTSLQTQGVVTYQPKSMTRDDYFHKPLPLMHRLKKVRISKQSNSSGICHSPKITDEYLDEIEREYHFILENRPNDIDKFINDQYNEFVVKYKKQKEEAEIAHDTNFPSINTWLLRLYKKIRYRLSDVKIVGLLFKKIMDEIRNESSTSSSSNSTPSHSNSPITTPCPPITTPCPPITTPCPPITTPCPPITTPCPPILNFSKLKDKEQKDKEQKDKEQKERKQTDKKYDKLTPLQKQGAIIGNYLNWCYLGDETRELCGLSPSFHISKVTDSYETLGEAIEKGDLEGVKFLLSREQINPAAMDNYAIKTACLKGNYDMVKLLLSDPRVNPATLDNRSLIFAAAKNNVKIVELLLSDKRITPSSNNNLAMLNAILGNHYDMIKMLERAGCIQQKILKVQSFSRFTKLFTLEHDNVLNIPIL